MTGPMDDQHTKPFVENKLFWSLEFTAQSLWSLWRKVNQAKLTFHNYHPDTTEKPLGVILVLIIFIMKWNMRNLVIFHPIYMIRIHIYIYIYSFGILSRSLKIHSGTDRSLTPPHSASLSYLYWLSDRNRWTQFGFWLHGFTLSSSNNQ